MKSFSEIKTSLTTKRDHIVSNMVTKTGLPKDNVVKLYESFSLETGGDNSLIEERFNSLLKIPNSLNPETNEVLIKELNESIDNRNYNNILKLISGIDDSAKLMSIIANIIRRFADEHNPRIKKIEKELKGLDNLMECEKVSYISTISDASEIQNTVQLYDGLKTVLSKNNTRWGYNYHLSNVYDAMWNYLHSEIEALTNKDNVNIVTDTFHSELLDNLMKGHLNTMYTQIDILRGLVPDIQTLVYDMVVFNTQFINYNKTAVSYISQDKITEYYSATEDLLSKISTSRKTSKLLKPYGGVKQEITIDNNTDPHEQQNLPRFQQGNILVHELDWNYNKYDTWTTPLQVKSCINAINIVKSCSTEFNLAIRPFLRNWVTKAFEILSSGEKFIIAQNKIVR